MQFWDACVQVVCSNQIVVSYEGVCGEVSKNNTTFFFSSFGAQNNNKGWPGSVLGSYHLSVYESVCGEVVKNKVIITYSI